MILAVCWVALWSSSPSEASPGGAPMAACVSMTPQHMAAPQASESAYGLDVSRIDDNTLSVSIVIKHTFPSFKGFLIQARRDNQEVPFGTFLEPLPPSTKFLSCSGPNTSVTHSDNSIKTGVTFIWRSPGGSLVGTKFVATTCWDKETFWVKYTSQDLGEVMGHTKE